jgi:hypothetical protein
METLSPEPDGFGMMFALQDDERLLMQIVSSQGWVYIASRHGQWTGRYFHIVRVGRVIAVIALAYVLSPFLPVSRQFPGLRHAPLEKVDDQGGPPPPRRGWV